MAEMPKIVVLTDDELTALIDSSVTKAIAPLSAAIAKINAGIPATPVETPQKPVETPKAPIETPAETTTLSLVPNAQVTGGDWQDGVWAADDAARISVASNSALKIGQSATLGDGTTRKVKNVEVFGDKTSVTFDGNKLDPSKVAGKAVIFTVPKSEGSPTPVTPSVPANDPAPVAGVNPNLTPKGLFCVNIGQAGGGETVLPGKAGTNYFWASAAQIKRWAGYGAKKARVGIAWERIQRKLFGPLDPGYSKELLDNIKLHGKVGLKVLVDVHNYVGYSTTNTAANRQKIGTAAVPHGALADVDAKIVALIKSDPEAYAAFYGIDLCNEPVGIPSVDVWVKEAQLCIDAIRKIDMECAIAVESFDWATTASFKAKGNEKLFTLKDPANRIEIHTHLYMDENAGGGYGHDNIAPQVGVNRMKECIALCKKAGFKHCLGEVGAPGFMPNALAALKNALIYARDNGSDCYAWWATETAKENIMSLEADRNKPALDAFREVFK
ncbi:endoglucanase [Pseudomonas lutea]|uniref:Endoglucanase n=2 Tax=Pseudomonas TaxID=286 RepID=A0A9X8MHT4_9PSED|nr:cellulase family glycosylhydrolase [Pseudomonas lutea]SER50612.1 endoglucanase [Pseudomonas lutea]